jgi:UDP-N-acetylglucosamine acyltransferase
MSNQIHPTAIINPKAELGNDIIIGPYVNIEDNVIIGNGTKIMQGAFIGYGARIGQNCTIHPHAIISNVPQDLKFKDVPSTGEVGDGTVIREFATLHRGTEARMRSAVGKNCFIMAYAHIAHDCLLGDNVILANSVQMGGHTTIDSFATIGGLTAIHQFSKIGSYVMVGGNCSVRKDVPPYGLYTGEPLAFMKLNIIGLRRKGFSPETIRTIEKAYNILYGSKTIFSKAIQSIKDTMEITPEVQNIISFVEQSDRGIVRAFKGRNPIE